MLSDRTAQVGGGAPEREQRRPAATRESADGDARVDEGTVPSAQVVAPSPTEAAGFGRIVALYHHSSTLYHIY